MPPYSKRLALMTILVILLMVFCGFGIATQAGANELVMFGLIVFVVLTPVPRIPLSVSETADSIVIRQIFGKKVFDKKEYNIKPVQLSRGSYFSIRRCFGSSAWVFWGYFWDKNIGGYFAQHVGDRNLLLLTRKRDGKKYLIDQPA